MQETTFNTTARSTFHVLVYFEHSLPLRRRSESIVLDDGRIKNASYDASEGFGLRAIRGEVAGYAHSTEINLVVSVFTLFCSALMTPSMACVSKFVSEGHQFGFNALPMAVRDSSVHRQASLGLFSALQRDGFVTHRSPSASLRCRRMPQ